VTYVEGRLLGGRVHDLFLEDIESREFVIDCGDDDMARIRILVTRYSDLPLGFADAAVVACAERNSGRILTLDADFRVVAGQVPLTIVP
jgi:predicted nucleic acid-binding protein